MERYFEAKKRTTSTTGKSVGSLKRASSAEGAQRPSSTSNTLNQGKSSPVVSQTSQRPQTPVTELPHDHPDMQVLRAFDIDSAFGPCVGMTRLERWERAQAFGLNPPADVYALVKEHSDRPAYTQCLWYGDL